MEELREAPGKRTTQVTSLTTSAPTKQRELRKLLDTIAGLALAIELIQNRNYDIQQDGTIHRIDRGRAGAGTSIGIGVNILADFSRGSDHSL